MHSLYKASNRTSGSLTQPQSCFIPTRLLIKRWFTPTIGITLFIPGHWGWTTITLTPQSREDCNLWISKVERLCPASDPHLYGLIFNGNSYFFLSIPSPPQGCVWAQGPREKNHTILYLYIPQSSFRYYLAGNVNNLGQFAHSHLLHMGFWLSKNRKQILTALPLIKLIFVWFSFL